MLLTVRGPNVCNELNSERQIFMRIRIMVIVILAVSGCTTVPEQIQGTYAEISPARVEPAVFGQSVRWGGSIIDAQVEKNSTCFEILSRGLDKYLRPQLTDQTAGRFIACKAGFYDPEVFTRGREVTLTGRIRNIEIRQIDEFSYSYPVIDVDQLVLWEVRQEVMVIDHPYDPFYHPYYWGDPYWGPYPYYRHPHMPTRSYARTRTLLPDPAEVTPPAAPPSGGEREDTP
jgi:outer membrane lipoprotein